MMTSEKKLLAMIDDAERQIHQDRVKAAANKQYFVSLMEEHKILLIALAVSSFIVIVERGKWENVGKKLRKYATVGVLEVLRRTNFAHLIPF